MNYFVSLIVFMACSFHLTVHAQEKAVLPIHFSVPNENKQAMRNDVSNRVYQSLQRQARFLLTQLRPWAEDESMLLLTESQSGEHWIRPNTGALAGFAFLYRFGSYDKDIVGLERDQLLREKIIPMMRYLIATHSTGHRTTSDGKPWGDAWQSAHWAHMLGRAGWWIWDALPEDIQEGIRKIVNHEAQRFVGKTPPSQLKNDTKAEENAWNAQIFSVAILLTPSDPQRSSWERELQRWALSSFLRPADQNSKILVDGRSISEQFYGANVYDDFTLENHGIVHPDYMTTFSLSMSCMLDYVMTQRTPPESLYFNAGGIYENLKWFSLPDGGFVYPSGQDWRLFRNPDWFFPHILMAVFHHDPDAWTLAMRSLVTQEKMQARSSSGQIYQEDEFFFASTQTDRLYSLSLAWLALQLGPPVKDAYKERLGVQRLDTGKIILNRTPHAIHTFSWGSVVMAQIMANRLDRIVSPDQRNGVGWIRLKDDSNILPVSVHNVEVENSDHEFTVHLQLNHGQDQIRADIVYHSYKNGQWSIREKLTALNDVNVEEIKTGLLGILNNPRWIYEHGFREISLDGEKRVIQAHSGQTFESNAKQIDIDGILKIQSQSMLHALYQSAAKPVRARTTDHLFLNIIHDQSYRRGDTISEFEAMASIHPSPK
ncbi:MAG: hypothetical protein ACP5I1_00840 [Candidatus Hinthialibacter sp.]